MDKKIDKFFNIDGIDYGFRRWRRNPIAKFDYFCTKRAILNFINKCYFNNSLEIGCGPGTWTPILKNHTKKIIAVDISNTMIKQAQKSIKSNQIQFVCSDIMNFQNKEKFDLIFSIRAFEYIRDKETFLKKCYNMLEPNGKIFIITKTKGSYWYGRSKIRNVLKIVLPILFYYENEDHTEHISNFWQERLLVRESISLLKKTRFRHFKVKPVIIRPPIYMRGKSEIPIIPPIFEKPTLLFLKIINYIFSNCTSFTPFAESYLLIGEKE